MKQAYEKLTITVTRFDEEDVITTSEYDKNNAYSELSDLDNGSSSGVPTPPPNW